MEKKSLPDRAYAKTAEELLTDLSVSLTEGLTDEEVAKRQELFGKNILKEKKRKTVFQMFLEQFKSFMILILLIAAVVSGILGEWIDTVIIAAIVILNAIMGVVQENKAENSMAALKKMSAPQCKLLRNGQVKIYDSGEIVPGDIVILETGDYIPADLRLME
ncbi:MAG: cation-transporting P-type ATPase, partial [Clostridiales bacterium]